MAKARLIPLGIATRDYAPVASGRVRACSPSARSDVTFTAVRPARVAKLVCSVLSRNMWSRSVLPDGLVERAEPESLDCAPTPSAVVEGAGPTDIAPHPGVSGTSIRRMLRSAAGTAFLQGTSTGLGFLTAVLLARLLGQDGYGRYTFTVTWAAFLTIPALVGMDQFLVRGIARYEVERRWPLMKG